MRVRRVPIRGALLLPFVPIVLALVALWVLDLPSASLAEAAPAAQAAPEPTALWPQRTLYGGPIHDLAVAPDLDPNAPDSQRVWAVGNGVFHAARGITWTRSARDLPAAVSIIAASAEVAFATDLEGNGYRTTNSGRGWSPTRLGVEGSFRFAALSPDFDLEEQVYAIGEQDGRLWRSSDRGSRWTEVIIERGA
jgi:hypothetical protein